MKCEGCPVAPGLTCLGESVGRLCHLARTRADYRRHFVRLATEGAALAGRPVDLDEVLAAVTGCPQRGGVLPVSDQAECGCSELTECRAGHGRRAGQVTLQDCRACRLDAPGLGV